MAPNGQERVYARTKPLKKVLSPKSYGTRVDGESGLSAAVP